MRYKLVCRAERRGAGVDCSVQPELLLASDPLANLEGTSSAIRFDLDVFGLSLVEHNPGIEATGYGLLADFCRAVRSPLPVVSELLATVPIVHRGVYCR